jgi:hypothetical protein
LSKTEIPWHSAPASEEYERIRNTVDHQLRHGIFERVDTNYLHGAVANRPAISGAIFLSLHPKQLPLLIADARTSIVLAVQRHLDNEQYRKRLAKEFHYRALKDHLSDNFLMLMVPPSHSKKYRFSGGRKPSLPLAYQAEIDRLEAILLPAYQHKLVDVLYGSCLRMRTHRP